MRVNPYPKGTIAHDAEELRITLDALGQAILEAIRKVFKR